MKYNGEHFVGNEPFETTVKRWAALSLMQLKDAYRTQKMYNGSNSQAYEVWRKPIKRTIYTFGPRDPQGHRHVLSRKTYSSWGWLDENALREQKAKEHPNAEYWYSTGESFKQLDVQTMNVKEVPEEFIVSGEVRFRSTMQAYFAEKGVGANGPEHARGRDITVDRSDPFSWQNRYVANWVPSEGQTHRPNVRQQVYYMRKRLQWLASKKFEFQVSQWLSIALASMLDTGSSGISLPAGMKLDIHAEKE